MSAVTLVRLSEGSFRLEGDLDFFSVRGLVGLPEWVFADAGELCIDLGGVQHANSAGLALLLEWLGQARRRERFLHLTNLPDSLERLARLSNLGALIRTGRRPQS